ncbi:MAG: hypothetical protein K2X72_19260 [Reyranella sp.]|nr:hypothetical protein [Reyranella sp.]
MARRFDLGFYAGRIFGLLAAGFLLMALIVELARMYAGALRTILLPEDEGSPTPPAGLFRPRHVEPAIRQAERCRTALRRATAFAG